MVNKDLRSFIEALRDQHPEELIEVERPVSPCFEIPAILRKLQQQGKFPAVFFRNTVGTKMPVISNVFASRKRLAIALETSEESLLSKYMELEDKPIPPKTVGSGPVKEVIIKGDEVDLTKLPIVTHCEKDAGPYITAGVMILKDPDTGVYDTGIFRLQLKGKDKLGVCFGEYSRAMHIIRKNEAKNIPTEVAIFIGHHPACILASQTKVPLGTDELSILGGLLGEPLEIVKCETVDIEVPAYAEIVIEGIIPPNVREPEAPFGEYTWYYGPSRNSHILKVKAMTHRESPIYLDVFSAHPDHNMVALLARESVVFKRVKMVVPTLKEVCLPMSGMCRHTAYISIKKEFDGQGKIAALAALASDPFLKMVVVVEDDIDVHNEMEVWWAVTTRTQPDRAIFMVPDAYVCELDPSAYSIRSRAEKDSLNTKWAIDATKPIGLPFEERADVPKELLNKIRIEEYLPRA